MALSARDRANDWWRFIHDEALLDSEIEVSWFGSPHGRFPVRLRGFERRCRVALERIRASRECSPEGRRRGTARFSFCIRDSRAEFRRNELGWTRKLELDLVDLNGVGRGATAIWRGVLRSQDPLRSTKCDTIDGQCSETSCNHQHGIQPLRLVATRDCARHEEESSRRLVRHDLVRELIGCECDEADGRRVNSREEGKDDVGQSRGNPLNAKRGSRDEKRARRCQENE